MKILDKIYDQRSNCCSLMVNMTLQEYHNIAEEAFRSGGNIFGQRNVIKKSTVAAKIRARMQDDFRKRAVFPAVVLGALLPEATTAEQVIDLPDESVVELIESLTHKNISIIDGMQRSNIYFSNFENNENFNIRVEFWLANESVKLLYRMLVLNTGQVPWNTRRQVEVVFDNLAHNIISNINSSYPELKDNIRIPSVDDNKRRTQAGVLHKSDMIQIYLAFNTRNIKVEVNDALADEFQRFDMLESIENDLNFKIFIDVIAYLFKLDFAFDASSDECESGKFTAGKDLFSSNPACIGFVVACAEYIMGKSSVNRSDNEKIRKVNDLKNQLDKLIEILKEKENYLGLETLNEIIEALPTTRIGDEMRRLFRNAFLDLLKYTELDELSSLEAFWRA